VIIHAGSERIAVHSGATTAHQVITQREHHQSIPLSASRNGKTLVHIQSGAPIVEQRPLLAYEAIAGHGVTR